MKIRPEVIPFILVAIVLGGIVAGGVWAAVRRKRGAWVTGGVVALVLSGYFCWFFRDPPRITPLDEMVVVSGAEGHIAKITELKPEAFKAVVEQGGLTLPKVGRLATGDVVRISVFLSLFDVHVNRAPIAGKSTFLGYFPGKHYFTFEEKSSDFNQHNSILIEGRRTTCLYNQIVGPVARRVVYWPDHDKAVDVAKGDPIGMMKFGSRLDMYFPAKDVEVVIKEGARVRAGETPVARLK